MRLPPHRLLRNCQSRLPPPPVADSPNCCARWRWRYPHRLLRQPRLRLQETKDSQASCRRWARRLRPSLRHRGFSLPPRPSRQRHQDRVASRSCCKPCRAARPGLVAHCLKLRYRVRLRRPIGCPDPLRPLSGASREPLRNCSVRWKAPARRRPSRHGSKLRLPPATQTLSRGCFRWSSHRLPSQPPIMKSASREASITGCLSRRRLPRKAAIHSLPRRRRSKAHHPSEALALRG